MAKRLTETGKWDDPWFCKLSERDRLFWIFLCDRCDHAGIWQVNQLIVESYFPGYLPDAVKFGDRIRIISPDKWFIRKFIAFQYKNLNPDSRIHASVLERLKKEGVSKGLPKGSLTLKDKDKDKEKVKAKDKAVDVIPPNTFEQAWANYPKRIGRKHAERHFRASVKTATDFQQLQVALVNYQKSIVGKDPQYIKNGSTWFNEWKDWIDYREERTHASNGSTSISEQIAKRLRESGTPQTGKEPTAGEIFARIRDLPKVQPEAGPPPRARDHEDGGIVGALCDNAIASGSGVRGAAPGNPVEVKS